MNEEQMMKSLSRLLHRLEPFLGRREPSIAEADRILKEHGLDKTLPELARMASPDGFRQAPQEVGYL